MREIELKFKVYTFDELPEDVQNDVIEKNRNACFESSSEFDWECADETIKMVEKLSRTNISIEQNSQGFYIRHCFIKPYYFVEDDAKEWNDFEANLREKLKEDEWAYSILKNELDRFMPDDYHSFERNVAQLILYFCETIYNGTMVYFDDDNVREWLISNEYEFTEDGEIYQ